MNRRFRSFQTIAVAVLAAGGAITFAASTATKPAERQKGIPENAAYACPMEAHPDQEDPGHQGAFFAEEPGKCPWCGMKLKPLDELEWVAARKAAGDAEVAYTCPNHQHVFSKTTGTCPRCGKDLKPFKVMYTCPNPKHAATVTTSKGKCPSCGERLVPFRGIWLDESMAAANVPPTTQPAADAPYLCPLHPLVHSDKAGHCTICGMELTHGGRPADTAGHQSDHPKPGLPEGTAYVCPMKECETFSDKPGECPVCGMNLKPVEEVDWARDMAQATQTAPTTRAVQEGADGRIPPGAAFVCPMEECEFFSNQPGECPVCGMKIKPIQEVDWARERMAQSTRPAGNAVAYTCPMHPQIRSASAGTCPICAMQLVRADEYEQPQKAPERIRRQLDHITEHYLALQRLLASDNTSEIARHALGVAAAGEGLLEHLDDADVEHEDAIREAAEDLRSAALRISGNQITDDRLHFSELSTAMVELLQHVRPDRDRWPHLYVFHCPMSKADWVQTGKETRNPYYGFKMLKCGELKATK